MTTVFQDLQHEDNPQNGRILSNRDAVLSLLDQLARAERPYMCQFTGDDGFNLLIGIAHDFGCAQHSSNDGQPPFLMATSSIGSSQPDDMEFLVGDTPTPIDGRYRLSFDELCEVVAAFVATGEGSSRVSWEQLT